MNYHIVYNNFKDYAELFIKNIDFSKVNINKVLFLHIGDEEAISEIIENTNFKNAEFYIKDEDSIYDIIETLYNEKVHKFLEYNNMEFDLIIANPPYGNLGNPIISEAISHLADNGTASVLMPLSCYKKNELYRHVETFNLANPKLFKDAKITNSLGICTLRKSEVCGIWNTKEDISISAADKRYNDYYMWNVNHNRNIAMRQIRDQELLDAQKEGNLDTYFFETIKCSAIAGKGGGFGPNGFGYKWNINKQVKFNNAFAGVIIFESKHAKDNFQKWWYNGKIDESMSSRVILGINNENFVGTGYFAIPQIDWASISDKYPNYEKDPDYYVLKEMGLKWDDKKETIIKE